MVSIFNSGKVSDEMSVYQAFSFLCHRWYLLTNKWACISNKRSSQFGKHDQNLNKIYFQLFDAVEQGFIPPLGNGDLNIFLKDKFFMVFDPCKVIEVYQV